MDWAAGKGMPSALADNASIMSALSQDLPRSKSDGRSGRLQKEPIAMCATDDDAIVPKKVDKQSLSYLWRSGTAGGLAGCVVSLKLHAL